MLREKLNISFIRTEACSLCNTSNSRKVKIWINIPFQNEMCNVIHLKNVNLVIIVSKLSHFIPFVRYRILFKVKTHPKISQRYVTYTVQNIWPNVDFTSKVVLCDVSCIVNNRYGVVKSHWGVNASWVFPTWSTIARVESRWCLVNEFKRAKVK